MDAIERAIGERLLNAKPRAGTYEEDVVLVEQLFEKYGGALVYQFYNIVHERFADVLVATVGLAEALRRAAAGLDELPYTGVALFGRLRDLLVLAPEAEYQTCRAVILDNFDFGAEKKVHPDYHWMKSFLLPLGPEAGKEEVALHEKATQFLGDYGNAPVHASAFASGDKSTAERFMDVQKPKGAGHEVFAGGWGKVYAACLLDVDGSNAVNTVAQMKPTYPWVENPEQNGPWCRLLAHIQHDSALEALHREHRRTEKTPWVTDALVLSARFDRARVVDFLKSKNDDALLDAVVSRLEETPVAIPKPPSGDESLLAGLAAPVPYKPPDAQRFADPTPTWAPAPQMTWTDAEREKANAQGVSDDRVRWNGKSLRHCTPEQLAAFVAHSEKWAIPADLTTLVLSALDVHPRLMAVGLAPSHYYVRYTLASVLLTGGVSHVPMLLAALHTGAKQEAIEVALPVGDVRLLRPIAEAFAGKKLKADAARWLLRHPEHAAAGAVTALLKKPKDKKIAQAMRFLAARGHRDLVEKYATLAESKPLILGVLDEDPLTPAVRKKQKLPAWANAKSLPALKKARGKGTASATEIEEELRRLALSNALEPHPAVPTASERWTHGSLKEFAWAVFEAWLDDGADAKQQWALQAVGYWGDDESVWKLTRLAKKWPGEGAGKRAQWALDALANIGTDVALTSIALLSEKSRFPAFRMAAAEHIANIAFARGISTAALADLLAPRLNLDEHGDELDFGVRKFALVFDETLMPKVRDESGKVLKSLPKAGKKDDKVKAKEATARFKALKKEAKASASLQIARLERAMQNQRAIPAAVFLEHFAQHPWMTHLAQRLVWALAEDRSKTFRVVEDGRLADETDEPFALPSRANVVVSHPLHLSAEAKKRWSEVLADYELLQPFPQLGRPVYHAEEKDSGSKTDYEGLELSYGQLRALERRGWERWVDSNICRVSKTLLSGGKKVDVLLDFTPGFYPGAPMDDVEVQTVGRVHLESKQSFLDLEPAAYSELVYDLEQVLRN